MSYRNENQRPTPQLWQAQAVYKENYYEEESIDTITGKLSQICLKYDMADVSFTFKGEKIACIPAHKMILALRSPVFKAMFYGSFPQSEGDIKIEDITRDTFQILVKYMYTDHLQLSKQSVIPLLYAAQKYQIAGLISKCENYLQDNLDVNNACTFFSQAKFFTMDKLRTNALKFIADNAIEVLKSEDFLLLHSENIVNILELDSLRVQEVDVIRAVLRWVDHQLTKSKIKADGKSRRAILLKDSILFTLAIPLLSIEEFTSIVIPCGILTDEEQLQIFKAITMSNSPSSCGKFRIHPREGIKVLEVTVNDIFNLGNDFDNMHNAPFHSQFNNQWVNLQAETFSVKANKIIKIKSVTINPQFQNPNQNSFNFNVNIKTQSGLDAVNQHMYARASRSEDRRGYETEECTVTMDVMFEGRACKLPIDKIIPQNEMLVMTIKPNVTNYNLGMWGQKQQVIKAFPPTYQNRRNDMMYQHKLSDQTTLYLSLTGGHLVESFEVLEIC